MNIIEIIEVLRDKKLMEKFTSEVLEIKDGMLIINQDSMAELVDSNDLLQTQFIGITQTGFNSKKIDDELYHKSDGKDLFFAFKNLQLFNGRQDLVLTTFTNAIFNNYKIPLYAPTFKVKNRQNNNIIVKDNKYRIELIHPSVNTKNFTYNLSDLFSSAILEITQVEGEMDYTIGNMINLSNIDSILSPFVIIFVNVEVDSNQAEFLLKNGYVEVTKSDEHYLNFINLLGD